MDHISSSPDTATDTARTFLVLGATGKTGSLVAGGLRGRGHRVRGASRSGDVRFDWDAPRGWGPVLDGVDGVYVVTPMDPAFRAENIASFVARAEAAGVRRLVLLSGLSAGYGSAPMLSREEPVRAAAVDWTILRPGAFQQNLAAAPYPQAVRTGELRLPLGPRPGPRCAYIDVADIAEVAATVLTGDGHAGQTYDLSGPQALTFPDVLATIGAETGRSVGYRDIPAGEWTAQMHAAGVGDDQLGWSLETFEALRRGEYAHLHDGVRRVLGREPSPFARFAKAAAAAGAWS
ncbi:NAD(P)H-binding protein [Streptomyces sp. MZ04]|uniref:NAD(P)H-binding protein n=1 Tax=Streptomyces sp. MZ04 TaxID=2559236 RepID=UPI00107E918B|nr:NAD(P)H-binding protein [Streptomyces sp. MZ04]TGB14720.1 SDR family NAD(P)-dependent oxidoreductase [Streptomyces sp. MZ04]